MVCENGVAFCAPFLFLSGSAGISKKMPGVQGPALSIKRFAFK